MLLTVYIPEPESVVARMIRPKSGIVGPKQTSAGVIRLDYEGNVYGATNIRTYADRIDQAANRYVIEYPTIARIWAPASTVIPVGMWEVEPRILYITDMPALETWLGSPIQERELSRS